MNFQLDYSRIADSIFALNALQVATTPTATPIGRYELPALIRLEQDALMLLLSGLYPYVENHDIEQGSFSIDANSMLLSFIEQEIPKMVLAKLQHQPHDLPSAISSLRRFIAHSPLPHITPHSL